MSDEHPIYPNARDLIEQPFFSDDQFQKFMSLIDTHYCEDFNAINACDVQKTTFTDPILLDEMQSLIVPILQPYVSGHEIWMRTSHVDLFCCEKGMLHERKQGNGVKKYHIPHVRSYMLWIGLHTTTKGGEMEVWNDSSVGMKLYGLTMKNRACFVPVWIPYERKPVQEGVSHCMRIEWFILKRNVPTFELRFPNSSPLLMSEEWIVGYPNIVSSMQSFYRTRHVEFREFCKQEVEAWYNTLIQEEEYRGTQHVWNQFFLDASIQDIKQWLRMRSWYVEFCEDTQPCTSIPSLWTSDVPSFLHMMIDLGRDNGSFLSMFHPMIVFRYRETTSHATKRPWKISSLEPLGYPNEQQPVIELSFCRHVDSFKRRHIQTLLDTLDIHNGQHLCHEDPREETTIPPPLQNLFSEVVDITSSFPKWRRSLENVDYYHDIVILHKDPYYSHHHCVQGERCIEVDDDGETYYYKIYVSYEMECLVGFAKIHHIT